MTHCAPTSSLLRPKRPYTCGPIVLIFDATRAAGRWTTWHWCRCDLFGPGDLAADFGHIGNTEHPEVLEAISTGVAAGSETSKLVSMSTADAGFAKKWFDKGCSFVSVGSDLQLLMRSLTQVATTAGELALRPEELHKP